MAQAVELKSSSFSSHQLVNSYVRAHEGKRKVTFLASKQLPSGALIKYSHVHSTNLMELTNALEARKIHGNTHKRRYNKTPHENLFCAF